MPADRVVARSSAGVSSFAPDEHDALVQEYADIGKRYRKLWALYGAGNVTERRFKSLLAGIEVSVRNSARASGRKPTNDEVEALAYGDSRATDMLHRIEVGRLRFAQAEIDLDIVREKLRRLDAVTRRGV